MTTVLICAGGTGGHVMPALSVAKVLREQNCSVHWLGTQRGIEARLVPMHDLPIHWIRVQGLRGKSLLSWALAPFRVVVALWDAWLAIKAIRPDVVLGMGGFVAGPGGIMAKVRGIPLVIHEQNARAGLTNRILARIANVVCEAYQHSFKAKQSIWVGNPVRDNIRAIKAKEAAIELPINLLVFGGSQGAQVLNRLLPDAIAKIEVSKRPHIRHQCGRQRAQAVADSYRALQVDASVTEFIDDMAEAYQWADVVIARAGALTVAELATVGVPAILIPFPAAVDDHQTANAQWLVDCGAALLMPERELTITRLSDALTTLLQTPEKLLAMRNMARSHVKLDSQEKIAALCLSVSGGSR
jgi:UDP-N-acetylglucosamine--N-acetylmuramyl-(pentapeptide) pyrophosphoryl-undecaprenol N-acetylglucosamine transferase